MANLTKKELLEKALNHEETQHVPVLPVTNVVCMKLNGKRFSDGVIDARVYAESELECYHKFGFDGVTGIMPLEAVGEALGSKLRYYEDDVPSIYDHVLKEQSDLKRLIHENRDVKEHYRLRYLCEIISELRKGVGPDGNVIAHSHSVFRLAGMLRGISNLYMDMVTDPEFVKELQEFCLPRCIDMALELVRAGANVIYITNPIANMDCISKESYRTIVHPFTKKLFKAIKDTGVKLFFHPCGRWTDRYDLLIEEGADAFHVDKVDLTWLKETYGDKVTIMGNVKTSTTMLLGTPDDVRKEALECIDKAGKNGGYILSADCVIPRDTPAENLRALVDAARM